MKKKTKSSHSGVKQIFRQPSALEIEEVDNVFIIKGQAGYRSAVLTKEIHEGTFVVACNITGDGDARLGIAKVSDNEIHCIGSSENQYAVRISDGAILQNGQLLLKQVQEKCLFDGDLQLREISKDVEDFDDNNLMKDEKEVKGSEGEWTYCQVSIQKPKNPILMEKYKDIIPAEELYFNRNSSVRFYSSTRGELGSVSNLCEGPFNIVLSVFGDSIANLSLSPPPCQKIS